MNHVVMQIDCDIMHLSGDQLSFFSVMNTSLDIVSKLLLES